MGLFSSIGKIVGGVFGGPVGSALGSVAGGLFDRSREKSDARKARARALSDNANYYARLRDSAEKGGFNPVSVLNAGNGFGSRPLPTGYAPLSSSSVLTDSLKPLERELTGEAAQDRNRQKVEDEFNRLQLERLRHDVSAIEQRTKGARVPGVMSQSKIARVESPETVKKPKIRTGKDPYKPGYFLEGLVGFNDGSTDPLTVQNDVDPSIVRTHDGSIEKTMTHADGAQSTWKVGFDFDELLTGWAMDKAQKNKGAIEALDYTHKNTGLIGPYLRMGLPVAIEAGRKSVSGWKNTGKRMSYPKDHPMSH